MLGTDTFYYYDESSQVVRVDNRYGRSYTRTYSYDERGNLTQRKSYRYTRNERITTELTATTDFTYAENGWKDRLTAVNGTALTYDANGNVLTYGNREYTWTNGRNLAEITEGEDTYSYTYDENGIRTSKTVNGVTTYYNTQDGVILSQTDGTNTWYFQYDTNGTPLGFIRNGVQYVYLTNTRGDVIGITDSAGNVLFEYVYDEWGSLIKLNLPDEENTDDVWLANANPLRYRGYYYDSETGYYYLQSRYYDPSICRFINSDVPEILRISKNSSVGTNSFAYCNNDAVNGSDPLGYIGKIDASIAIVMFVVYYVAEKILKLNSKYKIECQNILLDSMGNYIVKITYYKTKFNKKSFVLALGDKISWGKAKNINEHLNMEIVQNQANYIQSEYNKGPTGSLTGKGPDNLGIVFASATVGVYLVAQNIKVAIIKKYYNKVWGKNRVLKGAHSIYYLFNITKGGNKLNGWYAYNYKSGGVKKL